MHYQLLRIFGFFALLVLTPACGGGGGSSDINANLSACESLDSRSQVFGGELCSNSLGAPIYQLYSRDARGELGSCTATAINSNTALTAAHCIRGEIFLALGSESHQASSSEIHPRFDGQSENRPFDVAIVKFSENIFPDSLPLLISSPTRSEDSFFFFGYGRTNADDQVNSLEEALNRPLVGTKMIVALILADAFDLFTSSFEESQAVVCSGDSGGPAVKYINNELLIIGLASGTLFADCSAEGNSVFVNSQQEEVLEFITSATAGNVSLL